LHGESVCESNTPETGSPPHIGFEVRAGHQAGSAPIIFSGTLTASIYNNTARTAIIFSATSYQLSVISNCLKKYDEKSIINRNSLKRNENTKIY